MKKYRIGFTATSDDEVNVPDIIEMQNNTARKSVVRVYFPGRNMTLSYYNDMFDLHKGDIVYVDGKLEGLQGRIVDVNYSFKIKLSDYKRVIAVADTSVKGKFCFAGSHIISFDPESLPFEKVKTWFSAPAADEEYVTGESGESFPLDDLEKMNISHEIAERGNEYYIENRVCYISVDGTQGKAIVDGSENYIVEFTYDNGEISDLVCSCFCSFNCKHEFAVMLQLRECLEIIENEYNDEYSDYFAAISKGEFINTIFNNKRRGKIIFEINENE